MAWNDGIAMMFVRYPKVIDQGTLIKASYAFLLVYGGHRMQESCILGVIMAWRVLRS